MDYSIKDVILLLHPVLAVIVVFPLIGIVVNRALQVRQRRQQTVGEGKSKISPVVGQEHVQLGRWLSGSVVGVNLVALANEIFGNIVDHQVWKKAPFQVVLIGLMFAATIVTFALLYRVQDRRWRGIFATLSGMGLVILGYQHGVYRNTDHWYMSHYFYGTTASLLMIFSLAILRDIYQDRTNRWRNVHITLNSFAVILFLGQGITGTQALLEIPLAWQEPYLNELSKQKCNIQPCTIQAAPSLPAKH